MPKRFVPDPGGGVPGRIEEHGTWVATIAELRTKYWDPARRALVIPFTGGRTFEFGPSLLSEATDTTVVHVRPEFSYPHEGPQPTECSCGTLSFRHAVEYHVRNEAAR